MSSSLVLAVLIALGMRFGKVEPAADEVYIVCIKGRAIVITLSWESLDRRWDSQPINAALFVAILVEMA